MVFVEILSIIFSALWLLAILLYIPKFISWGYGFKKSPKLHNPKNSRIALVIPAKDEADCIGPLFDSIREQTYPVDMFDTYLVVDNADPDIEDPTITLAKEKLQNLEYLQELPQNAKGAALKNLFEYIANKYPNKYDAYIIVDADNILTPNFVEEMNNALVSGADVIIGKKLIKNWQSDKKENRNLIANISALTYTGVDTMGNKYKSKKGYSLAICGQGVLITQKFVDEFGGFPFTSLTEDIELNMCAILHDFKQFYYEHAQIYSEEPNSHKEYNKRRYRWLKGYITCNQKYRKQLVDKTFHEGPVKKENLNFLYELFPVALMYIIACVACLCFAICGIVLSILWSPLAVGAWCLALSWLLKIYLMTLVFNLILVLEDADTNKMTVGEKLEVIFLGPFITMEYAIIFLKVLDKNYHVSWEHVKRIKL